MNICDVCLSLMKSHTVVMKATLCNAPFLKVSRAEGVRDLSVPLNYSPKHVRWSVPWSLLVMFIWLVDEPSSRWEICFLYWCQSPANCGHQKLIWCRTPAFWLISTVMQQLINTLIIFLSPFQNLYLRYFL